MASCVLRLNNGHSQFYEDAKVQNWTVFSFSQFVHHFLLFHLHLYGCMLLEVLNSASIFWNDFYLIAFAKQRLMAFYLLRTTLSMGTPIQSFTCNLERGAKMGEAKWTTALAVLNESWKKKFYSTFLLLLYSTYLHSFHSPVDAQRCHTKVAGVQ